MNIAQNIIWVAGLLVAVGICGRALRGAWKAMRRMGRIHDQLEQVLPLLPVLVAEFRPNGGSSMRDRVDALSQKVEDFSAYQHGRNHDVLSKIQAIEAREQLRAWGLTPPSEGGPQPETAP